MQQYNDLQNEHGNTKQLLIKEESLIKKKSIRLEEFPWKWVGLLKVIEVVITQKRTSNLP